MADPTKQRRVRPAAIERDADAEIEFHLEMRIRELRAIGYSADAARREALRRFGGRRVRTDPLHHRAASGRDRAAHGARRADVTRMIAGDAIQLVVPGIVLGTLGALGLTRFLRALLYGVTPTDPATFAQLAVVMLAVAVAAAYLPAARAASADPMRVLRQE